MSDEFNWLHLSDLHAGLSPQDWLWPNFKGAFYDDLARLHDKAGPWHVVVFSGDLVQSGKADEFKKLDDVLDEVWDRLRELGSSPILFPVPGNHDLARPDEKEPVTRLLRRWWDEPSVREEFWSDASPYKKCVHEAFANYTTWLNTSKHVARANLQRGILPGDVSTAITVGNSSVGLVGLNSTWLQIAGGDFEGLLHAEIRQLLAVTADDPVSWCNSHDANLIITHHPPTWLNETSRAEWRSEVEPPGRFDAHLFGHMHTPDSTTSLQGGSAQRTTLQAASIFGLEKFANGTLERIHGYSGARLTIHGDDRILSVWPRRLSEHISGKRRLIPDQAFELNENNAFELEYSATRMGRSNAVAKLSASPVRVEVAPVGEDTVLLERVRYHPLLTQSHVSVRLAEQEQCSRVLREKRAVWLQSEWGLGSDGFIGSVQKRLGHPEAPTYRFDFSDYSNRERFLDQIKETLGASFEQLCELISRKQTAYIIFDDISVTASTDKQHIEADIERIAGVLLEYCPVAFLVLRTRAAPASPTVPVVMLRPLDEPDTAAYIFHAELGGPLLSKLDVVSKLHRHTDGAPARLDIALKELQVVRLSELLASNPDYAPSGQFVTPAPDALIRAVNEIKESTDTILKRCYLLLRTLSVFPQGEQLERIKRFNNSQPFFTGHAMQLMDRGLISAAPVLEIGPGETEDNVRILTVNKSIRDHIRSNMTSAETRSMDRRALELYFGQGWRTGDITVPVGHKFDDPMQIGFKLTNANALLLRHTRQAIVDSDSNEVETSCRIIASYLAALLSGDHYRAVVIFCGDLFDLLPQGEYENETRLIKTQYAQALRMIGEVERAKGLLLSIDMRALPKTARRHALLDLAMSHETLGEATEATAVAEETIKLGKNEAPALHAKSIQIELDTADPNRYRKLEELGRLARKRELSVLANNIALTLADKKEGSRDSDEVLEEVFREARKSKDFYNEVRAVIRICRNKLDKGEPLSDVERSRLIDSYHFLFNERLSGLFDRCHGALWEEFEKSEDVANLLRLFRHSSLIWRLRDEETEQPYLKRLAKRVNSRAGKLLKGLERERSYFIARASGAVLETDKSASQAKLEAP